MADDTEKILLDIEFNDADVKNSVNNIANARKAIDALNDANKKLVAQGEKNSKAYVENQEQIKKLNTEVSQNSKIVQANTQAVANNVVNIDALKKANKELLIERNKVDVTTEEGKKKISELNDQYDKNSAIIADNSTKVEKQRFNIGNYQSALSSISPTLGSFAGQLGSATTASGGLTSGLFGMVKASIAFVATPIGAIIAALVLAFKALQTFITGSTEGMDAFEQVTAGVSAVIAVATDRVVALVGAIGKFLSGDFSGGLDGIKDSFSGIGDEIAREVDLAVQLQKAIQDLEDREVDYEIATSKSANAIKKLVLESKNRSLTESQRQAKLKQALDLEAKQTEELNKIKTESLRISNQQALQINAVSDALKAQGGVTKKAGESESDYQKRLGEAIIATGKVLDDQRDKVKDGIIALNNAEGESLNFQEKIQNQADALAEKAEAKRQKLADDAEKRAQKERERLEKLAEEQKKIDDRQLAAANELDLFELAQEAKRAQTIEKRVAIEIAAEQLKSQQLLANQELTESERQLIVAQSEAAILEIKAKGYADQKQQAADALSGELEAYHEYVQGLINEEKERFLSGETSKADYDQAIADLQLAALETDLAIKTQFGEDDVALQGRITDAKIAQKQFETDTINALEKAKVDAVQNTLGQIAGLFNKNSAAFKALASAQALIQTYQSAQAVFTGMTSSIPGPIGIVLGIAGAAAAVISGLANVAKINSTKVPKLEDGGMIDIGGNRHSSGGEDVHVGGKLVANVEQGEKMIVLNRRASQSPLLRNLSTINKLAGGVDFFSDRAPRRHLADGGFVARAASSRLGQTVSIADDLGKIKLEVSVTDIEKKQDQVNRAKVTSELR
jgi:hypothetical protein